MPDRIKARVLVIALLLMLAVAGLNAYRPAGNLTRPASNVLVTCVLLEAVLAGLFIALRWNREPPADELAGKLHRMISIALAGCMAGVVFVLIFYGRRQSPTRPRPIGAEHVKGKIPRPVHSPSLPLRDLLIALLIIALITAMIVIWGRRGGLARFLTARRRHGVRAGPDEGVDEAAAELARAVESGRTALLGIDDAREAIIACYVATERSLAEAGAARGDAETPDELLVRTVAARLVPRAPAEALTGLFYEARYSTHPMPAAKRDQAELALTDIYARLPPSERP